MDTENMVDINLFGNGDNILGAKWTARIPISRIRNKGVEKLV
jgi:hypothetical protein